MARVSFEGVKRLGIALAWILLFALVGVLVTIGVANLVPGWGGGGHDWLLFRNALYALIGFLAATIVVGRLLAKESWDRLGWRGGRKGLGVHFLRGTDQEHRARTATDPLGGVSDALHDPPEPFIHAGHACPVFAGTVGIPPIHAWVKAQAPENQAA